MTGLIATSLVICFATKSTYGHWLEIAGAAGRTFPIGWQAVSGPQTARSTPEAETVSLADAVLKKAIPAQTLLTALLHRPVKLVVHEDNASCINCIRKGYSPSMRSRVTTQRTSIGSLHDLFFPAPEDKTDMHDQYPKELRYATTATHKGNLFTKELPPKLFVVGLELIRVLLAKQAAQVVRQLLEDR